MAFKTYKKGNCPVCGDAGRTNSNSCKRNTATGVILCRTAAKDSSISHPHYTYLGDTRCGTWARFGEKKDEWRAERTRIIRTPQKPKGVKKVQELSAQERDTRYRQLLATLDLTSNHINHLRDRGLSLEEIGEGLYRSVKKFHKVGKSFVGLPGVLRNGALNIHDTAILCPVFNEDGLVVALHARLENETDGRYRWLTSKTSKYEDDPTPHLQGELPVRVIPYEAAAERIWAVEGVSFKPHLTHLIHDVPVIGASGGNFTTSTTLVEQALSTLRNQTGATSIVIPLDAGDVKNPLVMRRIEKSVHLFTELGFKVEFAWWGQVNKSYYDVDEIGDGSCRYMTFLQFQYIKELAQKWGGLNPLPRDYYSKKRKSSIAEVTELEEPELTEAQRWAKTNTAREQSVLHGLYHPPDLVVDPTQKYLPDLLEVTKDAQFIAIKSPKGSGKSTQIKRLKRYYCGHEEVVTRTVQSNEQLSLFPNSPTPPPQTTSEIIHHKGLGYKFLTFNPRIALGRAQAVDWGHSWIDDSQAESVKELGTKVSKKTAYEELSEIGACADSLWKFFDRDWSRTFMTLDEIELFLSQILFSDTCKEKRSLILHTFKVKVRELLDNGGKLLIADADLSSATLEFFEDLLGVKPYLITHDYKGSPWDVNFYCGKPDKLYEQLQDYLLANTESNVAVACSSKRECEAIAQTLRDEIPGLQENHKVITIHGDNSHEALQKEFITTTNQSLIKYKPRVLLYTSSLGVGCSIDIDYFNHVFGFYSGVIEPSQFRQMLARVRPAVARSVWVKERAHAKSYAQKFTPHEVAQSAGASFGSLQEQFELLVGVTNTNQHFDISKRQDLLEIKKRIDTLLAQDDWNNPFITLRYKLEARRNFSLHQMALQLRLELLEEGHHIIDKDYDEATAIGETIREQKEIIKKQESLAIAQSPTIPLETALALRKKPTRTQGERAQIEKAFLTNELPGVQLTPEMVYAIKFKDGGSFYSGIKKYHLFTNEYALVEQEQKVLSKRVVASSQGIPFLPDFKSGTAGVRLLQSLGLAPFLIPGFLYHKDSPEVVTLFTNALRSKKKLWNLLGIHITKDSCPIKLIERLLRSIGLQKVAAKVEQSQGKKTRFYCLDTSVLHNTQRLALVQGLETKLKNSRIPDPIPTIAKTEDYSVSNTNDKQLSLPEEWNTKEALADVAGFLEQCRDKEMLSDVLHCVPRIVVRVASWLLPARVRAQLRMWAAELLRGKEEEVVPAYCSSQ